ncbi:MAG TPA: tetraacyldisaccharide 4'-kinase [Myxococcota bacterium]|jgi:tetraacyldisaccharide 4'-kinase|nr:tetraacyldisaccharide 4'-kinase [Myxococcota bacterium]
MSAFLQTFLRRAETAADARLEAPGPLWRAAMALPAALYGAASAARLRARAASAVGLAVPIVSVGALSVGGVGKTPAVRIVVEALLARGRRPAVVTNGCAADETTLLAAWLGPQTVVLGARAREDAAREAAARGADVVVLDDAFQYTGLKRGLDVLCVDPADPLEGGHVLPAGRLREPVSGLHRAGLLWTFVSAPSDHGRRDGGHRLGPDEASASVTRAARRAGARETLAARVVVAVTAPVAPHGLGPGAPVALCTGVARPRRVAASARAAGLDVRAHFVLPDHADLDGPSADRMWRRAAAAGARLLVTTEKDACRPGLAALVASGRAAVLGQRVTLMRGAAHLEAALDAVAPRGPAAAGSARS